MRRCGGAFIARASAARLARPDGRRAALLTCSLSGSRPRGRRARPCGAACAALGAARPLRFGSLGGASLLRYARPRSLRGGALAPAPSHARRARVPPVVTDPPVVGGSVVAGGARPRRSRLAADAAKTPRRACGSRPAAPPCLGCCCGGVVRVRETTPPPRL